MNKTVIRELEESDLCMCYSEAKRINHFRLIKNYAQDAQSAQIYARCVQYAPQKKTNKNMVKYKRYLHMNRKGDLHYDEQQF